MFNGIKLPHRTSTRPADQQPLLPKRQGHGTPAPSSHVHPELTGRGSPGGSAGAMAPRGNPFLKRSDALSPQAQANAHAAYQGPRVRFAAVAEFKEGDQAPRDVPMNFEAKGKPQRAGRSSAAPAPLPSAPTPAPVPPQSPERQERKPSIFGGLFHRAGSSSPPRPTQTATPATPREPVPTPADRFNARLDTFLKRHPDEALKQRLAGHLGAGNLGQFGKEAAAALRTMGDQKAAGLLKATLVAMEQLRGEDFTDLRINHTPKRPAAAAAAPASQRAPDAALEKFNRRLTEFLAHHPHEAQKSRLVGQLMQPISVEAFKKEIGAVLMTADNNKSFALMQSMLRSLNQMSDEDFTKVRIDYRRSRPN